MTSKTQTIAGWELELIEGERYRASRPAYDGWRKRFPVTILHLATGQAVEVNSFLNYDEANDIINEFNNGPTSFEGRVW